MKIDSYSFGSMTIDGVRYTKDLIILGGEVVSPWWRSAGGHVFSPVDLKSMIEAEPEVVVFGIGYFGRVKVLEETRSAFASVGTEVLVDRTGKIVDEFNRYSGQGRRIAAAFHLTC